MGRESKAYLQRTKAPQRSLVLAFLLVTVSFVVATAYSQSGAQLTGYSRQSAALATKRFKASLTVPGSVFMLTRAPDGNGNVLLEIDKDSGQPRARVDLGKEREPVYAVDDVAGMLFLRTAPGTLVGYRL